MHPSTKAVQRPLLLSTLVFVDLETTGLPSSTFKPEITELCMLATSRFSVEQSEVTHIRVQNKLNLCFYPNRTMNAVAARVSGLNKTNLFHQKDFDSTAVKMIQLFVKRLDPPVCFLAHNGNHFDFPLLRAQLCGVKGEEFRLLDCEDSPIICADTLPLFAELNHLLLPRNPGNDSGFDSMDDRTGPDNKVFPLLHSSPKKPSVSFRLGDVYSRVFGSGHAHAHSAEGDCIAMLKLVHHLGLSAVDWLQVHYTDFNSIPPMYRHPLADPPSDPTDFPYKRRLGDSVSSSALKDTVEELSKFRLD
ncbi:hypothetical protein X801_01541 [Opisthorchis viverrini]|uniref:Uncharacterized protein n=2 Tax=Opisthorchis viverrini TaxID=6198 RepID=A0A1S8X774_OPIVI|nr:hypothetical protein T265_08224 [Opisthorchis viverrini]KER24015.1 hypothetical protein T265_08224 [Opisthorchis viverrini]OON22551.1 hypothetical protein X801_01541 [Opisthorchis viverrini]